jgi:hypothetical protein
MAEFAAVGLAGSIITFIDFSAKLLHGSREIYASGHGSSAEHMAIETITTDLKQLVAPLATNRDFDGNASIGPLKNLAAECESLALSLLFTLNQLKAGSSHKTKWRSFKLALMYLRKEAMIQEIQERLDKYRQQIIVHLVMILT